ncbi:MAG TPA: FecR family protein [Sunxiuqinia sp.]|nr:FecR family protein [Sunxiuqinia sp.]
MDNSLFHKILQGRASEREKDVFYEELQKDENKRKEFIRYRELWDVNRLTKITTPSEYKREQFQKFWATANSQESTSTRIPNLSWIKYAAIFIVALAAGFYLNFLTSHSLGTIKQFHAENGSVSSVLLDDGSKIWLNANSTISLNEQKNKVVAKLSGEAYFEIKHNEHRKFIIDLGKIKIRDLGTSFNISAYPEDDYFRTTLFNGKIAVLNSQNEAIKALDVNQTFSYNQRNHTYKIEQLDPTVVTGWKENKFVFIDKPLAEICHEIEKWYGVIIIINDANLKSENYTSVIRRPSTVKQMLDMFKLTTGINYQMKEQNNVTTIYLSK